MTGAGGWVGCSVATALRQRGFRVRELARTPAGPDGAPLDLLAPLADGRWSAALAGCAAVVHCAAHVHRPDETAEEIRLFEAVNVEGTAKLVRAAQAAGIERFVLVSSSVVYGASTGVAAQEGAAPAPMSAYGRSKVQAEELVRGSALAWVIARPATIFGGGDRANFRRLAHALRRGRFVVPGAGEARKSVLPVDLAGALLARLAVEPIPAGTVVNLALPEAPTLRQICDGFSRELDWPRARSVPRWLLSLAAKAGDGLAGVGGRAPLTTTTLGKLTASTVVDVTTQLRLLPRENWPDFAGALRECADSYATA